MSLMPQAGEGNKTVPATVADNDHAIAIGRELYGGGRYYFDGTHRGRKGHASCVSAGEIQTWRRSATAGFGLEKSSMAKALMRRGPR